MTLDPQDSQAPPRPAWMARAVAAAQTAPGEWFDRFAPPAEHDRQSAVLMLFAPDDRGEVVVLTERAADMRSHPGQVSFPGGRFEDGDGGPVGAALREAAEEVGLEPEGVDVVATLPSLYLRPSENAVTPVLAYWPRPHPLTEVDPAEVARVDLIAVDDLLDPRHRFMAVHPRIPDVRMPGFDVDGLFIWGFTAMLLSTLFDLGGLTRAWDVSREFEVPERFFRPEAPS